MGPDNPEYLLRQFQLAGPVKSCKIFGSGHIHDTYLVTSSDVHQSQYVLQKFNHLVFTKPQVVMDNITKVITHIKNIDHQEPLVDLKIIPTHTGATLWTDSSGAYWRVFNYIENSFAIDRVESPEEAYQAARAYGSFFFLLRDMEVGLLQITIPDFHHVGKRFRQLKTALQRNPVERAHLCTSETSFALSKNGQVVKLSDLIEGQSLPLRVTHNDTKINNVLFDADTRRGICVVDLDTVMPGYLMYDFGDMVRTFCNAAAEEDPAVSVEFRLEVFTALCEGFFSKIRSLLTPEETQSLRFGPWLMTYLMGIRFLADYISGDVYYKINYPFQNIDRAKNQLKLVAEIEKNQHHIDSIIARILK